MNPTPWTLLDPTTRIEQLAPCALLVFTDREYQLVWVRRGPDGGHQWERVDRTPMVHTPPEVIDGGQRLEELGRRLLWREPDTPRFLTVPGFTRSRWPMLWGVPTVVLGVVTMLITLATNSLLLFVLGFVLTMTVPRWFASTRPCVEILGQQQRGITQKTIHAHALAVERGDLWQDELPAGATPSPAVQVERIRQEYAELRSDLVYRLENPALFDPAAPTTAAFEAALVDFADAPSLEAAGRVEVRFRAARQHAEKLGMGHVARKSRKEVARAAKVARLAVDAPSAGERRAALQQLQRILEPLALYYLPSRTEFPAIEG